MSTSFNIIAETKPLNLIEERAKFLANPNYNPQFIYRRSFEEAELIAWGTPKEEFYLHARQMIEYWNSEGKKNSPPQLPLATESFILEEVATFNQRYTFENPLVVKFTSDTVTRCSISGQVLTLRLPITYTQSTLRDLLRHEFETHYLRKKNNELQPWAKESFPDETFRRTEEGLANLHTFLLRQEKLILKTYHTYLTAYLAQRLSFVEVYKELLAISVPPDMAFLLALRTKRGRTDTAQPGGLTKDITYFEGSVQVWDWIMDPAHLPQDLYLGRISLEQISTFKHTAVHDHLLYPSFFADMAAYHQNIAEIGKRNQFQNLIGILREDHAHA